LPGSELVKDKVPGADGQVLGRIRAKSVVVVFAARPGHDAFIEEDGQGKETWPISLLNPINDAVESQPTPPARCVDGI